MLSVSAVSENISRFSGIGVEGVSDIADTNAISSFSPPKRTCQCSIYCSAVPKEEGSEYYAGHRYRSRKYDVCLSNLFYFVMPWPCGCGCGNTPKRKESKYCCGHNPISEYNMNKRIENLAKWNKENPEKNPGKNPVIMKKLSESRKKHYKEHPQIDRKTSQKMRESRLVYIEKMFGLGGPARGKYEKDILDFIERTFKTFIKEEFTILRQYRVIGYSLDGYSPELNIAFEVDEEHHFDKDGNLNKKDIYRQEEIKEKLGCTFIRIEVDLYLQKFKEVKICE